MANFNDEYCEYLATPDLKLLGWVKICANYKGLTYIGFVESAGESLGNIITQATKQQLIEYFDGKRQQFDLPTDAQGTDFQKMVWKVLCQIPFGVTQPYQFIATLIQKPTASRAVGAANGRNPLSIIVPCHRIIGSNGKLTGYAGGLERKAWLLAHEKQHAQKT